MVVASKFADRKVFEAHLRKKYGRKVGGRVVVSLPPKNELSYGEQRAVYSWHGNMKNVRGWFGQVPLSVSDLREWNNFRRAIDPHLVRNETGGAVGVPGERYFGKIKRHDIVYAGNEIWFGWPMFSQKLGLPVINERSAVFKEWLRARKKRIPQEHWR